MKLRYTAAALLEVEEIFNYIAERNRVAAIRVRSRIEQTVTMLAEIPEMAQLTDEASVRRIPINRYPYVIFYTLENDAVTILHVRHSARRNPWEANG